MTGFEVVISLLITLVPVNLLIDGKKRAFNLQWLMNKKTLATVKAKLEEEKKRLENELADFTKKDTGIADDYRSQFPEFGNDEDENAAEVAEYSDRLSLEHTLEKQLRDVNQALESITKKNYGICKHCGQPIEEQRLLIRPTSSSCVSCKKKLKGEN